MSRMNMRPSWRKVVADLWANRTRTLLVVASIAVGVFAVGAIATAYVIFGEDIAVSYASAQPANIEVITDPFNEAFVESMARIPGVKTAEGRHMVSVRVSPDGRSWRPLDVMAAPDYDETAINLLTPVRGKVYPADRELIVREDPMNSTGLQPGDEAFVQLADGTIRAMPVTGLVGDQFAAGDFAAPPRGYTSLDTAVWLGGGDYYNRLYVQVENGDDEAFIQAVADRVEEKVERTNRQVYRINTNKTTEHPMASTALAMIGVLGALGVLIMLLSSSLIFNTLNALLTQHRRQIGVMKLVGARSLQISLMYMALIIMYGVIALLIAVPLGMAAGYGLADFMGSFMSVEIQGFRVIPAVIVLQTVIALAVPLAAGYFPVNQGARTTVRRALSEDGPVDQGSAGGASDRLGRWMKWVSRPLLLSIRNTFRRKGRLALTLFTLIVAGAIFIAVFNVRASLDSFMDMLGQHFMADVIVSFNQPYRISQVEEVAYQIPGVEDVEAWGATTAKFLDEQDDVILNAFLIGPPGDSELLDPDMLAGRWLTPEDGKVLVVSDAIWREDPDFKPGDTLRVEIPGERVEEWPVIGIFRFINLVGDGIAYTNFDTIAQIMTTPDQAASFRVVADATTMETQSQISRQLDAYLRNAGFHISNVEAGMVTRQQNSQAINILVIFLLLMALLTAVVGSIGLAGTMGMNVLERTREIGVMRAIGAVDAEIIKSVVIEGVLIGLISWAAAVVLSFPISFVLLRIISTAMIETMIPLTITIQGFVLWLAVVVALSVVASMMPARSAARLTIREVLAYE